MTRPAFWVTVYYGMFPITSVAGHVGVFKCIRITVSGSRGHLSVARPAGSIGGVRTNGRVRVTVTTTGLTIEGETGAVGVVVARIFASVEGIGIVYMCESVVIAYLFFYRD